MLYIQNREVSRDGKQWNSGYWVLEEEKKNVVDLDSS